MGFTVRLAKQDFKFSAAHFTIFDEATAEPLHGHNYQVSVEIAASDLDELGFLVDLDEVKHAIRRCCAGLDNRTLVAESCKHLQLEEKEDSVVLRYADRLYRFPASEVVLLPIRNVTMEELARLLWRDLADQLNLSGIDSLSVRVQETEGQSCTFEAVPGP